MCTSSSVLNDDLTVLVEIGSIFSEMGIDTIERAQKVREHIENCSGGMNCIKELDPER